MRQCFPPVEKVSDQTPMSDPGTIPSKHYWRLTLRSAPMLGFALLGQWHEQIRIFRWKWVANTAARHHKLTAGKDVLTDSIIERYIPGSNVVAVSPLNRRDDSRPTTGGQTH